MSSKTSQDVQQISIVGDKEYLGNKNAKGHEISYSYLKDNYGLGYKDLSDGTREWTCYLPLYEPGSPRTFELMVNGEKTTTKTSLYVYEGINVTVNGKAVSFDVSPQIINGRTMIPIRAVAEVLGGTVSWQESTNTTSITAQNIKEHAGRTCYIKIGDSFMKWESVDSWNNGRLVGSIELDSPAVLIADRTLAPIRAIAECFGYDVKWDEKTSTVIITG